MSRRATRRATRRAGLIALALAALVALAGVWTYRGPGPEAKAGQATDVVLPRGAGVSQIAETLRKAGVISSATVFAVAARLTGAAAELKAGEYEFASGESMARVLADIRHGRVLRRVVAVPEGWTSGQVLEAVMNQSVLIGTADEPAEGSILPDTYQVQRGEDRAEVIRRMQDAQRKLLAELWPARQPGLPFTTQDEAVTLASIVERETGVPSERPRVAAVFVNRLRAGMALQSDPTVIYAISKGRPLGRGLTVSELATRSPYNTYVNPGLPPTPIANPGRAALEAVLNPPKTTELYFVANGTGGHAFASSLEEHQKNVARWREIERGRSGQ